MAIWVSVQLFSQVPEKLQVTHYDLADGLVHRSTNCLLQDHRGFLWVGTQEGLQRFDGSEFVLYREGKTESSSLPGYTVLALAEDDLGRIWIATNQGLCWLNTELGVLHQVEIPGLDEPMIWSLLIQDSTRLWVGTANHVHRISLLDLSIESFQVMPVVEGMSYFHIDCMFLYEDETIIGAGASGLHVIETRTGKSSHELCGIGYVFHVTRLRDDQLLICTFGKKGTFTYDFSSGQIGTPITYATTNESNLFFNGITDVEEEVLVNGERILWVTGGYGLKAVDAQSLQCIAEYDLSSGARMQGANEGFTYEIVRTRDGSYWVTSQEGLFKVEMQEPLFNRLHPITNGTINDGFIDPTEKSLFWLIKNNGAVELHDLKSKKVITEYQIGPLFQTGERVSNVAKAGKKGVWILSQKGGLYHFDLINRRFEQVIPVDKQTDQYESYQDVEIAHDGLVWISTPTGLCQWDPLHREKFCTELDSLQIAQGVNGRSGEGGLLFTDRKHRLWFLYNYKSCFVLNPGSDSLTAVEIQGPFGKPLDAYSLHEFTEDTAGDIWLGGYNGVFVFNETRSRFEYRDIGFPRNGVSALSRDAIGRIWGMNGPRMYVSDPRTGIVQSFSSADGLNHDEIWKWRFQEEWNTLILFYSDECIFFNPNHLIPSEEENSIGLVEFRLLAKDSLLSSTEHKPGLLHYEDNDLRFVYKLLDYKSDKNVHFSYFLQGCDEEWIEAGTNRAAVYTNLRNGDYEFWVKAEKLSGEKFPAQKLASFTIETPYWRTLWFRTLAVAVLITLIGALYRYRINQLRKIIHVRSKISSDLHDNVGSALTSIRVYSEMARRQPDPQKLVGVLDKIEETAGDMIQSMSDIVWTINPKYDDFTFVIQRMENFAANFLSLHEIEYAIHRENGVESVRLPMEKRKNLFLIFKEVINNTAKHAGCKKVDVHFAHDAHQLRMTVADDGVGFDTSILRNGNGLSNMRQRALQMGGEIEIDSTNGNGTTVSVKVPV